MAPRTLKKHPAQTPTPAGHQQQQRLQQSQQHQSPYTHYIQPHPAPLPAPHPAPLPAPLPALLPALETNVANFVSAMQHCKASLAELAATATAAATHTSPQAADTPETRIQLAMKQEETEGKRKAFEEMHRQWMGWAPSVVANLEAWLGTWHLGIAERMAILGLLDRMAWYRIKSTR